MYLISEKERTRVLLTALKEYKEGCEERIKTSLANELINTMLKDELEKKSLLNKTITENELEITRINFIIGELQSCLLKNNT